MLFFRNLFFLAIVVFLFSFDASFAQSVKYSVGPVCKDKKVVCKKTEEEPVCIVLNPKVHVEMVNQFNNINRYQPVCIGYEGDFFPSCIDLVTSKYPRAKGVIAECLERVSCKKGNGAYIAYCNDGKVPKCLGSDNKPDCNSDRICEDKSLPVCDYVWEAVNTN